MQTNSNLVDVDCRVQSRTRFARWFIPLAFIILLMSFAMTLGKTQQSGATDSTSNPGFVATGGQSAPVPSDQWLQALTEPIPDEPNVRLSAMQRFDWLTRMKQLASSRRTEPLERNAQPTEDGRSGVELIVEKAPAAAPNATLPVAGWVVTEEKPAVQRKADEVMPMPMPAPAPIMADPLPPKNDIPAPAPVMADPLPPKNDIPAPMPFSNGPADRTIEKTDLNVPQVAAVAPSPTNPVQAAPQPLVELPRPGLVLPQLPEPRRLNQLDLGRTPQPTAKELQKFAEYVKEFGDPTNTLDLVQNRARLMILTRTPTRIQIADETIVSHNLIGTKEITLLGKTIGATTMSLWFPSVEDKTKEVVLHYLVRVFPDPEEIERLRRKYKALEIEINQMFKDSVIHLTLVGTKVVISGTAHDIRDATEILRLVTASVPGGVRGQDAATNLPAAGTAVNTPGTDNYLSTGNSNIINLLNITGVQQVGLRVVVAEINRTAARSIGLNLSVTNRQGLTVFENTTGSILSPFGGGGGGGGGTGLGGTGSSLAALSGLSNLPAILDNGQIVLAINALKSMHYAKSLAEPNLVALNGKTATFQAGGEFPVPVVTGGNALGGLQGVSFVPYGVQLNFTPFITDKDRIRLNVSATISTRDTTTGTLIGTSAVPGLSSRNFTSTVELREGQTLAVAGLIQTNLGADRDQIPFLGEIPFINRFTGFDRTSSGEQELVILITPELVQPLKCGEPQPRLPGADYFDPSDIEFYLFGRLEGRRSNDFRSPVMSDFHRIQNYNRCEQIYIFGPTGYEKTPGPVK